MKRRSMGTVKKESPLQRKNTINIKIFLKAFYKNASCHSRTLALQ